MPVPGPRHTAPLSVPVKGLLACVVFPATFANDNLNGREIGASDTQSTKYAAIELATRGTLTLDAVVARDPELGARLNVIKARGWHARHECLAGAGPAPAMTAVIPAVRRVCYAERGFMTRSRGHFRPRRAGQETGPVMVGSGAVRPAIFYRAADLGRDVPASPCSADSARKPFTRRGPDRTPLVRRAFQAAFILLNLWIGARFYVFVRFYETGGQTGFVDRPPGVEGWLPIAGLMNLKYALMTRVVPDVHPAAMFLLVAFIAISFAARKAFCSWLCPIGTISEWLWEGGREMFGRNFQAPRWLDIPLRSLKYLLLGFFGYAVATMTVPDLQGFITSPYGLVADVKMLNFFRRIGTTGAVVIAVLLVGSVFVKNLWCRYLCPYGALVGLVSLFSPARIRRDPGFCIDCAKCAKACPSLLPVDRLTTVKSAECTGCLECVAVCPAQGALRLAVGGSRAIPTWAVATAIAALFFGIVGYAQVTGRWHSNVPDAVYRALIPEADSFGHPQ